MSKESSVIFSLKELMALEDQRQQEERGKAQKRIDDAARELHDAMVAQRDAEQESLRLEEDRRAARRMAEAHLDAEAHRLKVEAERKAIIAAEEARRPQQVVLAPQASKGVAIWWVVGTILGVIVASIALATVYEYSERVQRSAIEAKAAKLRADEAEAKAAKVVEVQVPVYVEKTVLIPADSGVPPKTPQVAPQVAPQVTKPKCPPGVPLCN